jgi:hypothetical protein
MIEVRWDIPEGLDIAQYNKTRLLRSIYEQVGYQSVAEIDTQDGDEAVTRYIDNEGNNTHFYLIRFYDSTNDREYLDFMVGYFPMTPKERRIINYILGWVPDIMKPDITEGDLQTALRLSLNAFNVQSPATVFTIDGFPANYEQFLVQGVMLNISMLKYLKLAIRDFSYSDMGLTLNLDRGAKITKAMEDIDKQYKERMALAKLNFAHQGLGLGTVPLPISMGGQISRSALNFLDLFNSMGR